MNTTQKMMAVGALGLGLLAGCSSSDHDDYRRTSSRTYDPYSTSERSYDPYDARTAGSERGPWRDADGNLTTTPTGRMTVTEAATATTGTMRRGRGID